MESYLVSLVSLLAMVVEEEEEMPDLRSEFKVCGTWDKVRLFFPNLARSKLVLAVSAVD